MRKELRFNNSQELKFRIKLSVETEFVAARQYSNLRSSKKYNIYEIDPQTLLIEGRIFSKICG